MDRYRRDRTPGASFFFTVTLRDRRSDLLTAHIDILRAAFVACRRKWPFRIDAIVVLPDHLHAIWTLPDDDSDYPRRWRAIKTHFAIGLRHRGTCIHRDGREKTPWQKRYWEQRLRDDRDFAQHVDYIHYNPVKHGHAATARDWRWSSFARYVREGKLSGDWGADDLKGPFGERP